jgi:excisionase family DNA binding protein
MVTTPAERGFYYATECRYLLSQDHAINVDASVITKQIKPPKGWTKSKKETGVLKASISFPSRVWEIDLASFDEYRERFETRRDPERPEGTLSIAEAAERLRLPRKKVHELVYDGIIPSMSTGECEMDGEPFRVIDEQELAEWAAKHQPIQ